ncbi:thioredoxin, putative [Babesia caballi]|uniref:Thioredoxin, putative n=1 Tax=Babesia caballi TaxID=5871 RepID=A0AAV4LZZ6_BABCB|nr:thioredoxin, putative [Babesia caballi]
MHGPGSLCLAAVGCFVALNVCVQFANAYIPIPDPPLAEQLTEETYEDFLKSTDKTAIVFTYPSAAVFGVVSMGEFAIISKVLEGNPRCKLGMYQVNLNINSPAEDMKPALSYLKDGKLVSMPGNIKIADMMTWITRERICEMRLQSVESARYYVRFLERGYVHTLLLLRESHRDPELEELVYDTVLKTNLHTSFMIADRDDVLHYVFRLYQLNVDTMQPQSLMVTRHSNMLHPIHFYWGDMRDTEKMREFLFRELVPPVHSTDSFMLEDMLSTDKTIIYIYTKDEYLDWRIDVPWLNKFARKHSDKFVFIHSKGDESVEERLNQLLVIDADYVETAVRAFELHPEKSEFIKYKPLDMPDGVITQVKLMNFINDLRNNKIPHFVKSEMAIPENIDVGHVKTIVGEDFHRRVIESESDVLILFFSPWCGHCHHAKRVFRDLGRRLKSHPSVVIAKFDAFNNEVEQMSISSYPTILLFPHGAKNSPVLYTGAVEIEPLAAFLESECKKHFVNSSTIVERELHHEQLFERHTEL